VGHNPGLDYLLSYLWGNEMRMPEDGKLLPTAAVARLAMPQDWAGLATGAGTLLSLTRPGQMQGA
jgi:phosphohistidine phosphatase